MAVMEKRILYYLFLVCFLLNAVSTKSEWCIARLTARPEKMQGFIDYYCSLLDCSEIKPGGSCFEPNLIPAHANYCLNAFYKLKGVCNPEIADITTLDPCIDECNGAQTLGRIIEYIN